MADDADDPRPPRLSIDPEAGGAYPLEKMTRGGRRGRTEAIQRVHDTAGRQPPHAEDVEQAVLGAMLLEPKAVDAALEVLPEEAFYHPRHQKIYGAVRALASRQEPVDLVTLTQELRRRGDLEGAGGPYYLAELTAKVASAANVDYHARIIAEKSLLRRFIETATLLVGKAYDPASDAFELLDEAERDIFQISDSQMRRAAVALRDVVKRAIERLESIHGNEGGITGVPSGFTRLDGMTGGWQNADLVIVAARPSMGKTALSLAMARNAALHPQKPVGVAYFSLEMSSDQLAQRLLTSEARVDAQAARTGRMSDQEWAQITRAAGRLSGAPIFIDDTPGLTILELRAKCRRLKAEHGIGIVIVDYLQLMHGTGQGKNANREQEIAQISRSLKALAKELDVPVIALAQLSRAVETRGGDKRPQLSDLRESGCLTGDTRVMLTDGRRVPIATLAAEHPHGGVDVWALDPATYRLAPHPATRAFSTGTKPVFRLTTRLGRTLRATGNHRFLTIHGWKHLDELAPGERIALPRRIDAAPEATMTDAELALLGHLIGDGCTLPRHAIQYTTREADLAGTVAGLAAEVFGGDVAPRIVRERTWYQVYLASTRRHTHGVRSAVAEWLDAHGAWGLRSHEKRVPEAVFAQPTQGVARFLRHLWATDGCARTVGGRSPRPAIYYATSSRTLARDVQGLLVRIGICARVARIPQKGGRDQFHVIVSGRSDVLRFCDRVGAAGAYRQASLSDVRAMAEALEANTNRDVLPSDVWGMFVRPAMRRAGLSERAFQAALGTPYCGSTLYRQNLSRTRALRVAGVVGSDELRTLAESDVYWDAIAAIEPDGVEEVFDLTVPGPHNFVAEDIVVHNSIEQDADVVAFLYRAERYGITVDDRGNSTEGIAELIIGKQRNGPIGSVEVAFVNQYARFENLAAYHDEGGMPYDGGGYGGGYSAGPADAGDGYGPPEGNAPF